MRLRDYIAVWLLIPILCGSLTGFLQFKYGWKNRNSLVLSGVFGIICAAIYMFARGIL